MLVHPVVIPGSGTRSWTVLGDDDVPVVPVDRFLAYLTDIGRSPNMVKAYAHDMKDLWEFLGFRGPDWREARLEDIAEFVAWLQLPPAGRSGAVAVLRRRDEPPGRRQPGQDHRLSGGAAAERRGDLVGAELACVLLIWPGQMPERHRGRRRPGCAHRACMTD